MISVVGYLGLRCYDSCLTQIIKQEHGCPEFYFCRIWKLPWKNTGLMGERLQFKTELRELLVQYAGMENAPAKKELSSLRFENGHYTILEVDTYEYPFHRLYQIEHTNHFCLFSGWRDGKITLVDPMLSNMEFQICPEQLEKTLLSVEALSVKTVQKLQKELVLQEMEHFFQEDIWKKRSAEILKYFENELDLKQEYAGLREGKYEIPLYRSLWALMFSRKLYKGLLEKIFPKEKKLAMEMDSIFENWKVLRGMLVKLYLQGKNPDERTVAQMEKILEREVLAAQWNFELLKRSEI